MALDAASITLGDLVFSKCHQEAGRRPALFVRSLSKLLPQLFDGRQPQFVEEQRQREASMVALMRFSDAGVVERFIDGQRRQMHRHLW